MKNVRSILKHCPEACPERCERNYEIETRYLRVPYSGKDSSDVSTTKVEIVNVRLILGQVVRQGPHSHKVLKHDVFVRHLDVKALLDERDQLQYAK